MNSSVICRLLAGCLLLVPVGASAAQRVDDILEQHSLHGSLSPVVALEQLQAASDRPGPQAPIGLRSRYHFSVGMHASASDRTALAQASANELETLAATGRCEPCAAQALLVRAHLAHRAKDRPRTRELMGKLDQAMPRDEQTRLRALYFRTNVLQSIGEVDAGMQAGIEAARLAEKLGRPSDQARVLNLMVLLNITRRDLAHAEALSKEGYALAERIGDLESMIYLRSNQGFIHSLRKEPAANLRALQDVLELAAREPALREGLMAAQINLADYHYTQGNFAKAVDHARAGEKLAIAQGNPTAQAVAMHNRAKSIARLGQREAGIALLKQAIALAQQAEAKLYVLHMHNSLERIYKDAGRYQEALQVANTITRLNTQLIQSQREEAVLELQEKYSAERKSREIERLSLEQSRQQAEVRAQAWKQRLLAALVVSMLLAAALLVQWLLRARERQRALAVDNAVLSQKSSQDPQTGAFNRRHCERLMGQQEATLYGRQRHRHRHYRACVSLIMLDLDHQKKINEQYGPEAGDAVLVEVVSRVQALLREKDAVVRWGGEEFVLVLPGTPAEGLRPVAQRVLNAIAATPFNVGGVSIPVTASAGGVAWPVFPGQHWDEALHVADLALYLSKSRGRNRATCLVNVAKHADFNRVHRDLAEAEAQGEVTLGTVLGPVQGAAAVRLLRSA